MTFEQECAEYLRSQGYRVSKPNSAPRKARRLSGKRHEGCADHEKVAGYLTPVCILSGQDPWDVLSFARDMLRVAAEAGDVLTRDRMARYGAQEVRAAA